MAATNAKYHSQYLANCDYYRALLDTYGETMADLEVAREAEAHGVNLPMGDMATIDFVIEMGY